MTEDDPRHGSNAGYCTGCRCRPCRDAVAAQARHYRTRQYLYGDLTVPSIGTRRRIQALMALGWSSRYINERLGKKRTYVTAILVAGDRPVFRTTAEAVKTVYDELSMKLPPQQTSRQRQTAARARNHAKKQGWVVPLAWDDDAIDNQRARPVSMKRGRNNEVEATRVHELEHLAHMGDNLETACTALGIDRETLWKWCARHGHRDLYERLAERSRKQDNQWTSGTNRRTA